MHVVATAGHVDHGKSALIRALTGMEPDRLADERRRGLTLDLGFAWTTLDAGEQVAFVDVPGHERFVPTMLAGVGPVPAVLFVVAADEGWRRQSAEHLAALDALGVTHGVLAVTRADLADPAAALSAAKHELDATGLRGVEAVAVSGATGAGLTELRAALGRLVAALPVPDPAAPVRLWIDRAFTIRGAGTVVTGTLPAGTIAVGDELSIDGAPGRPVRVRGLESLKRRGEAVRGVARVAVNLRGVERDDVRRGLALTTPGAWWPTTEFDVALTTPMPERGQSEFVLHVGSASVPAHVRVLGPGHARVRSARPVPLHVGDRALLRDPGAHAIVAGVRVLDVDPPALARRGAARARAEVLARIVADGGWRGEVSRRGMARAVALRAMGIDVGADADAVAGWLVDPPVRERMRSALAAALREYAATHPLDGGMPAAVAQQRLGLPDARLLDGIAAGIATVHDGRLVTGDGRVRLPDGVRALRERLDAAPYAAPEAADLVELGLSERALSAAVREGVLTRVAPGIYLAPEAVEKAPAVLAALPQPFTLSQARQALGTTRRVAVPLLELLDARGNTRRPDASLRIVVRV